jgi:flagellar basal body-associated protein FliL
MHVNAVHSNNIAVIIVVIILVTVVVGVVNDTVRSFSGGGCLFAAFRAFRPCSRTTTATDVTATTTTAAAAVDVAAVAFCNGIDTVDVDTVISCAISLCFRNKGDADSAVQHYTTTPRQQLTHESHIWTTHC